MNTITAYNKPLVIFEDYKGASTDEAVYMKNKDKLDILKPYFASNLCNIWDDFFQHSNPSVLTDARIYRPSLGVFCSKNYGLMEKMFVCRYTYDQLDISNKELCLRQNTELFEHILNDTDDNWSFNFGYGGGFYEGNDPGDTTKYYNNNKQNELTIKYYNLIMQEMDLG